MMMIKMWIMIVIMMTIMMVMMIMVSRTKAIPVNCHIWPFSFMAFLWEKRPYIYVWPFDDDNDYLQVLAPHSKQHLIFVPSVIAGQQEQILQVLPSVIIIMINNHWSLFWVSSLACSCWTCTVVRRLALSMRAKVNISESICCDFLRNVSHNICSLEFLEGLFGKQSGNKGKPPLNTALKNTNTRKKQKKTKTKTQHNTCNTQIQLEQ